MHQHWLNHTQRVKIRALLRCGGNVFVSALFQSMNMWITMFVFDKHRGLSFSFLPPRCTIHELAQRIPTTFWEIVIADAISKVILKCSMEYVFGNSANGELQQCPKLIPDHVLTFRFLSESWLTTLFLFQNTEHQTLWNRHSSHKY